MGENGEQGQASGEYVALIAVAGCVLLALVALTSGGLGSHVLGGLQRGLCAVTGRVCAVRVAERDRLAPCPLERRISEEKLSETIASVKLGSSGTLTAVRSSDGRVVVTLADGSLAGAEIGVGARLLLGRSLGADAKAGAALAWGSGRSWQFPDAASAARFVASYGDKATMRGKLADEVRSACSLLCDALGWRPHPQLPPPDEIHVEGGAMATLTGAFGIGAEGDASALLGRRVARDGETTWYLRLGASAGAALRLPGAEAALAGGQRTVLSYRVGADGRPLALGVHLAAEGTGRVALAGGARRGRGSGSGASGAQRGGAVEVEATLDLADPANRAAAAGVLAALRDGSEGLERAGALGRRLAQHGQVDVRRYAMETGGTKVGATVALGLSIGGAFERTTKGLRLVAATTRLPGLPFLPRDDCRPAA